MKFLRSKRGKIAVAVVVVAALCLFRPGANRLRSQIVRSISLALGRPVEVSSVSLRLLPQPGFELEHFIVHEDPSFGSEPMLRAREVTALLRISSLFRGQLEISTLSLTEPSLNLVRRPDGHWNLETLVERADKIPVAPTGKIRTEKRLAFPYIEATQGRINFKFGAEKKPYSLTDADFSLWQDSENAWGMRLKAQPTRTDFNLTDTGLLRVDGSWQRADGLRNTPLHFSFSWDRAQLGQLTKLIYGSDKGWRGSLHVSAGVSGTPAKLLITSDATADDFRRYDIGGGGSVRLAAHCSGHYSSIENAISEANCAAPVANGSVRVTGTVGNPLGERSYDVSFGVKSVPMQAIATLARHMKLGMPDDLIASGEISATATFRTEVQDKRPAQWRGRGEITGFRLQSAASNADVASSTVAFVVSSEDRSPRVTVSPFHVFLGRLTPVVLHGEMSHEGYEFHLKGEAQLQKLLEAARIAGLPALQTTAEGFVRMDGTVAGVWARFAPAAITGRVHLHAIRARLHPPLPPLEILDADLLLDPGQTYVKNLTAAMAGTSWRGSLTVPRPCASFGGCAVQFDLHANEIAAGGWKALFFPGPRTEPWYHFGSATQASNPVLEMLDASGKLSADKVMIHGVTAGRASATVHMSKGKIDVKDLRADLLGGRHNGEWSADLTASPPKYKGSGFFDRVALSQLASTNAWIGGVASLRYQISLSGATPDAVAASASGTLTVEGWNGSLRPAVLSEGEGPLQIRHLTAKFAVRAGKFEAEEGELTTEKDRYQLAGTASAGQGLNLRLIREGMPGFTVTGTLMQPRISPLANSSTQAALRH